MNFAPIRRLACAVSASCMVALMATAGVAYAAPAGPADAHGSRAGTASQQAPADHSNHSSDSSNNSASGASSDTHDSPSRKPDGSSKNEDAGSPGSSSSSNSSSGAPTTSGADTTSAPPSSSDSGSPKNSSSGSASNGSTGSKGGSGDSASNGSTGSKGGSGDSASNGSTGSKGSADSASSDSTGSKGSGDSASNGSTGSKGSGDSANHSQGNAGTSGYYNQPQPYSGADQNNTGANDTSSSNQYASTRDGSPSGNGNGKGAAEGKPCAGCVGKADNKNPQGQYPNGSDHNAGYECDRNHGIGRTNPAHTGCRTGSSTAGAPAASGSDKTSNGADTTANGSDTAANAADTTNGSETTANGADTTANGADTTNGSGTTANGAETMGRLTLSRTASVCFQKMSTTTGAGCCSGAMSSSGATAPSDSTCDNSNQTGAVVDSTTVRGQTCSVSGNLGLMIAGSCLPLPAPVAYPTGTTSDSSTNWPMEVPPKTECSSAGPIATDSPTGLLVQGSCLPVKQVPVTVLGITSPDQLCPAFSPTGMAVAGTQSGTICSAIRPGQVVIMGFGSAVPVFAPTPSVGAARLAAASAGSATWSHGLLAFTGANLLLEGELAGLLLVTGIVALALSRRRRTS